MKGRRSFKHFVSACVKLCACVCACVLASVCMRACVGVCGRAVYHLFLGPLDLLPWRVVGRSVRPSVRPSTPVTRQPIFGSFSNLVEIFLGWIWLDLFFIFVKFWILNLKKINFNLKIFKSSFSQNLPDRICSILAYMFLRMVLKHCKEVYTLKSL